LPPPVAPFAGAWIETQKRSRCAFELDVAPFAGAWIETPVTSMDAAPRGRSRPSRARGLKLFAVERENVLRCRALRGRVD